MAKHKHYDLIVAWAEGKQIQVNWENGWQDLVDLVEPDWAAPYQYRVKPEPKPETNAYVNIYNGSRMRTAIFHESDREAFDFKDNHCRGTVKLTFDGETGKLKSAEVINQD
jgi:hypothetical protein